MSWPYRLQKNAIGTVFAHHGGRAYVRPAWTGWRRGWALPGFWTLVAALLTTQSRQASSAWPSQCSSSSCSAPDATATLQAHPARSSCRRSSASRHGPDQIKSGNQFNSVFQRLNWFQDSMAIWETDPWFGVGLRWWYTDRFPEAFQPPNALMDTATAAGIVGLAAFLVLLVGTWLVARRIDPAYGILAELVLLARFVQSEFDLFWVSVQVSLPFLILGLCLGAAAHSETAMADRQRVLDEIERAVHPSGLGSAVIGKAS